MASNQIILPTDFDVSKISFGGLKTLESGGKSMYLNYGGDKFVVQTPMMHLPFGITNNNMFNNKGGDSDGKPEKWFMDMSFKDWESRPVLARMLEMMGTMDSKLIDTAFENSFTWFKKKHGSRDIVKELYTPMLKYGRNKETGDPLPYPPTLKVVVPTRAGEGFLPDVYDTKKNKINLADVETKGARAMVIMQCTGIWIVSGRFGCTWKALQIIISPPASLKGFAFLKNGEDDMELEEESDVEEKPPRVTAARSDDAGKKSSNKHDDMIESSDDDGNDSGTRSGVGAVGATATAVGANDKPVTSRDDIDDDIEDDDDLEPPTKSSGRGK